MKIIFFGSSYFSAEVLTYLLKQRKDVVLVVTQQPKPAGRHYHQRVTPVEEIAREAGLKVYAPERVNDPGAVEHIRSFDAEVFIVISYGQILSGPLLSAAKIMPLAIHPSLLPRYRGASPIQTAIIHGDEMTGVTLIRMNTRMDAGEIIVQESLSIAVEDTVLTLTDKLIRLSCGLLARYFESAAQGNVSLTPQDPALVTLAPKLTKEQGRIDWHQPAKKIYDRVRGMLPWPGAFTVFRDEQIKIHQASFSFQESQHQPGTIIAVSPGGISVAAGNGVVDIHQVQRPGKRVHSAADFVHGSHVQVGERLG